MGALKRKKPVHDCKQLGVSRSKTAYLHGWRHNARESIGHVMKLGQPRKPSLAIPQRQVRERACPCGATFTALDQANGRNVASLCPACRKARLDVQRKKLRKLVEPDTSKPRAFVLRYLRCAFTAEVETLHPAGGWTCGRNASHPVVAEVKR